MLQCFYDDDDGLLFEQLCPFCVSDASLAGGYG